MNLTNLKLDSLDNRHIIIDVGLTYTKCGFAKDPTPMHIVPTPFTLVQNIRENLNDTRTGTFATIFENERELYMQVEEHLTNVFYNLLHTNPKEKSIVVLESLLGNRKLTEAIGHCCFKSFGSKCVYFVLGSVMPLYATGMDTGIVVDCGFQQCEILPICRSKLCPEALEVCYAGGIVIEKEVNRLLMQDNQANEKMLSSQPGKQMPKQFPNYLIEHIKTRCVSVLQRPQKIAYMPEQDKMANKKFILSQGRAFYWFPYLQISLYTRMMAAEVCFGDVNLEEANLAYSILQSVMKTGIEVRGLCLQNIVLAGGSCMLPDFKKRLLQELRHLISTHPSFEQIKVYEDLIQIPECVFAPNICQWVGASLMMSLGQDVDRFLVTNDQYQSEGLTDRFGNSFLLFRRKGLYFNRNWEINYKQQKQNQYAGTSPYSARSLASKHESISIMLKKRIGQMGETPKNS